MKTATSVNTETEVQVTTSTKVIAAIIAQVAAVAQAISKKRFTAQTVRAEANRLGYDKKQAHKMVTLCWFEAHGMQTKTEQEKADFLTRSRPDVSKVIALAFPEKQQELDRAYAHNDKLGEKSPKQNRIGENNLLKIARGETTVNEVLQIKAHNRAKKSSNLDSVLTPQERFSNSIKAQLELHKIGQKNAVTEDEARELFEAALKSFLNPKQTKKTK